MTRRARLGVVLSLAVAAAGAAAATPRSGPSPKPQGAWQEIPWPFPRDAWPAGRAFRCNAAGCGGPMEVYVRPKVGFCNCATGISGDAERWMAPGTSRPACGAAHHWAEMAKVSPVKPAE